MAITLRGNKSQALTFNEMDGNFTDLDGRVTTVEGAYVKTINGVSPSSNAVTITTANITENTNLYYTDARARAAISVTDSGGDGSLAYNSSTGVITYTGPSASEVRAHISAGEGIDITAGAISGEDASASNKGIASFSSDHFTVSSGAVTLKTDGIDDTHIDFGTGAGQVSTADVPEQTNLYYTNARADARIAAASIDDLSDVELGSSQVNGHGLVWNAGASRIELGELPGAAGGEANSGQNVGGFNQIFQGKAGVTFNFRTIDHGDNITITQNTDDIKISLVSSPEFGNLKINSSANTIENISTNANIVLKPNGTGVLKSEANIVIPNGGNIGSVGDTDAISISAGGVVTMNVIPVFSAGINVSGGTIAGTLATAAQTNITTVGTLTTLTVDNVIVNGTTIGHTSDTDLITLASGQVTIAGALDVGQLKLTGNKIESDVSNADLTLDANGTGSINVSANKIINLAAPAGATDATTKTYVDTADALKLALAGGTMSGAIAMATQKITGMGDPTGAQDAATKAYVDAQLSSTDLTISTAGDSGSGSVSTSQTLTVAGTSNEIETSASSQSITVGLPSAVTVTTSLTVPTAIIDEVTIAGNNITTNASNADLVLIPNGTGAVRTAAIVEIAGEDSLNGEIRFEDSNSSHYVALKAPDVVASNVTLTLPVDDGTSGQALITDGSGVLSFGAAGAVVTNDESTNAERLVYVGSITSGALTAATQDSGFTYNPSSGLVTAAGFVGALTGNAATASTASVATTVTAADESSDSTCFPLFATAATGNVGPKTDSVLTYNASNGTLGATNFSGVASSAKYADLAEKYTTDESYLPGTIMEIGGNAETTAWVGSPYIAGVISTDPAYLMNSELDGQAIALVGRVPIRVIGSVTKGQAIKADSNGVGSTDGVGPIVGIALETNSNLDEKSVECMLKV